MLNPVEVRPRRGRAPGDQYSDAIDASLADHEDGEEPGHPLDSVKAKSVLRQLLEWFYYERERQAENRLEMAMDADFYDGIQWDPADAAVLRDRGQMPLVYNELAPMIDWIIGTERRTRVDWKVLPRTEDDVDMADVKTKSLKYVSDINHVPFARSRAFADAVKSGVGWVDDGVRDDPTQDVLYSKYEDWRNVLWDSASYELDLSDARFLFRWRWVDLDIALAMFPERQAEIRQAAEDYGAFDAASEEDTWYFNELNKPTSGKLYSSGTASMVDAKRRRVKLIEAQYRMPCECRIVADGPMRGTFFNPTDRALSMALAMRGDSLVDKVMMRVHVSVFTEGALLSMGPSIFRHNRFSLTPIWCYRRGRDRQPYGAIRRGRDIQMDLNKRASKALFILNTNQIIADTDATDDWDRLRDEVNRPDGDIAIKKGANFQIRRDTDAATGQIQMMTLAAQSIQKTAGVNNENLGRQTNAVSGAAIEARQNQGAVGTSEIFDNLRFAVQIQGEKQLSLIEQFYTEEKVIRLTGHKGNLEWLRINKPELQPDGSYRYLNDISSSAADFVVSEADYAGTLRQVMFDSLNQIAGRLPPEVAIRLMRIAFEFSDLPNKDEIVEEMRAVTGERDPNKELTPEEAQAQEEQMMMQTEALQIQRETARLALEEARARVREINAKAASLESQGGGSPEMATAIRQVRAQASDQIDAITEQLRKVQGELANRTLQIQTDADVRLRCTELETESRERVAKIVEEGKRRLALLAQRMDDIEGGTKPNTNEEEEAT